MTDAELMAFVVNEVELLDRQAYEEWLALFAEDAHYWMPLSHGQTDARLQPSLMYEDTLLLKVRIERLKGARTFSQQPASRGHHLIQQPVVRARDDAAGLYTLRHAFHYVEARGDAQQLFAGWATHTLKRTPAGLRIVLKRVDLLNCDAAHGNIQLFM